MKVVADFEPPDARQAAQVWRDQHATILEALPPDAILIDTGRAASGGDFVRIRVDDEFADRFRDL